MLLSPALWTGVPQATEAWDLPSRTLLWRMPVSFGDEAAVLTADGRFVVARPSATDAGVLRVVDTDTRAFLDIPTDFRPSLAHPRDVAVFGIASWQTLPSGRVTGAVTRLDLGGWHTFDLCPARTTRTIDLTLDGGTLLALCDSGEVVTADAATGAVRRTVAGPSGAGAMSMRANADGSAVYLLAGTPDAPLLVVDTATGAVVDTITTPQGCLSTISGGSLDRTRLVLGCFVYPGVPTNPTSYGLLYDATSRTFTALAGQSVVGLDPDNVRVVQQRFTPARYFMPPRGFLGEFDLASSSLLWQVPFFGRAVITYPPLAPALQAVVTGARVDLQWRLPAHSPAATGFTLEIGTAPGLTDIGAVALGPTSTLQVPNAPAGAYTIRVRAANFGGIGAPSAEVRVVVP